MEHLNTPPASEPSTKRLRSSCENDKLVTVRKQKQHVTKIFSNMIQADSEKKKGTQTLFLTKNELFRIVIKQVYDRTTKFELYFMGNFADQKCLFSHQSQLSSLVNSVLVFSPRVCMFSRARKLNAI